MLMEQRRQAGIPRWVRQLRRESWPQGRLPPGLSREAGGPSGAFSRIWEEGWRQEDHCELLHHSSPASNLH